MIKRIVLCRTNHVLQPSGVTTGCRSNTGGDTCANVCATAAAHTSTSAVGVR